MVRDLQNVASTTTPPCRRPPGRSERRTGAGHPPSRFDPLSLCAPPASRIFLKMGPLCHVVRAESTTALRFNTRSFARRHYALMYALEGDNRRTTVDNAIG